MRDLKSLIGNTPVIKLLKLSPSGTSIYAKLEAVEPTGSIKDVMALYMMELAEKRGQLKPGARIIELTSGNTGISFSMLAALKGYKFMAVMPEHMSLERRQMMRAFGAELVLTPKEEGFPGARKRLEEMMEENPDAWFPRQFDNADNVASHREITAKKILEQVKGRIDAFVCGVGTGGTLMGVAQGLREAHPAVKVVAVEPAESAVLSGGEPNTHIIQGIGSGFIPGIVDMSLIDQVLTVRSEDAVVTARRLAQEEGLMVGISSGANVTAALQLAAEMGKGKTVVTILPDRGERYLSMGVF